MKWRSKKDWKKNDRDWFQFEGSKNSRKLLTKESWNMEWQVLLMTIKMGLINSSYSERMKLIQSRTRPRS